ncbi:MAG TPA: hypothetical protein VHX38_10980 [Pseudonocardiaceae bacterium]|jgi:Gpi18-like mannosyltransferase|nr:hypothetical protein [Pseudonocardiaceae bacterium]
MTTTQAVAPPSIAAGEPRLRRFLVVGGPGLLYLGVQGVALLALWLFTTVNNRLFDLHAWDGDWYLAIARYGYTNVPASMTDALGHHNTYSAMAFFPAYPVLIHIAEPLEGGSFVATAITISVLFGVVAAYAVARLAKRITGSTRASLITVVLVAAAPMSIIDSMAYPVSMLIALSALALVGVLERRWTLAGWCAGVAGLVQPTAVAVIAVVMVWGIVAAIRDRDRFHAVPAVIVAPAGFIGYFIWIAAVSGSPLTYFRAQSGWNTTWDWGVDTVKWSWSTLTKDSYAYTVLTVLIMLAAVGLLVGAFRRVPWPAWAFAAASVVVVLGESGIHFNKTRELLPAALVLMVPVAVRLGRMHLGKLLALTALIALGGIWYSAYSLSVWHYGI